MVPLLSCAVHSSLFHPADLLLDLANERPGLFTHRPPDCVCYTPPLYTHLGMAWYLWFSFRGVFLVRPKSLGSSTG